MGTNVQHDKITRFGECWRSYRLLILELLLILACVSCISQKEEGAQKEEAAIQSDAIQTDYHNRQPDGYHLVDHSYIVFDKYADAELLASLPDMPDVTKVVFDRTQRGKVGLEYLRRFPNVETLVYIESQVLAEELTEIPPLENLAHLSIYLVSADDQRTNDSCLSGLVALDSLKTLNLHLVDGRINLGSLPELANLEQLDIIAKSLSDTDINSLPLLSNLKSFRIRTYDISSDPLLIRGPGLRMLAKFPKLERLSLMNCAIGDQGLVFLPELVNLTELSLIRTAIVGHGFSKLNNRDQIESLTVSHGVITNDVFSALQDWRSLEYLQLRGCLINKISARQRLPRTVKWLNLDGNDLHSQDISGVLQFSNLISLGLCGSNLRSESLHSIDKHPTLTYLDLSDNPITFSTELNTIQFPKLNELKIVNTPLTRSDLLSIGFVKEMLLNETARVIGGSDQAGQFKLLGASRFTIKSDPND